MTPPVLFFLGRSFKFDQERLPVISSVDITAQAERNRLHSKVILHYARHPRQGIVVKIVFSLRKRRRQHLHIVALETLGNPQEAEDTYRALHLTGLLFKISFTDWRTLLFSHAPCTGNIRTPAH